MSCAGKTRLCSPEEKKKESRGKHATDGEGTNSLWGKKKTEGEKKEKFKRPSVVEDETLQRETLKNFEPREKKSQARKAKQNPSGLPRLIGFTAEGKEKNFVDSSWKREGAER